MQGIFPRHLEISLSVVDVLELLRRIKNAMVWWWDCIAPLLVRERLGTKKTCMGAFFFWPHAGSGGPLEESRMP